MITVNPQGQIYLCKTPLENDYKNQLTFSNKNEQLSYFNSVTVKTFDNYTYIKKDNQLKVGVNIDEIIDCNYLYYINNGFTQKHYFCFISDMTYINENCTLITFETDVFQTFQFDIIYKKCFVEREHVNNDTIGVNTVPENLELGEYVSTKLQPTISGDYTTCFCIAVSELIFSSYSTLNELIPTGLYYIGVENLQGIRDIISLYDSAGKSDAVYSVFIIPKEFFSSWTTITDVTGKISTTIRFSTNVTTINVTKTNYLANDYVPKNKKLLTFPYSFLQVSNHNGSVINYHWEEFNKLLNGSDITFNLRGAFSIGGSFSCYPLDYKNILNNFDESITLGKFPVGGWNSDAFTNWLTQNGVNIGLSVLSSGVQLVAGVGMMATGAGAMAGASSITSGALGIANTLGQVYEHSLVPDNAKGNTNVGDYSFAYGLTNLEFKRMSIKNEYAKIIDEYFSAFGYKVNLIKYPNITGRRYFNYVKTIDCNLEGEIPQIYINKLKDMFNMGVTLWHDTNNFLNYDVNNVIV